LNSVNKIFINENNSLTNLKGLEQLNPNDIQSLVLTNCTLLKDCNVTSICNYLKLPNSKADINNNATGCATRIEVEEACANSTSTDEQNNIYANFIYNPTYKQFHFYMDEKLTGGNLSIFYSSGQLVKSLELRNPTGNIQLTDISPGLFIYRFTSKSFTTSNKFIVN